ncbi:MAG: hypothetical protein DWI12_06565 [Planctomycetota bacterium]|nr:MAG: hypothetical protein DWI12_06565 [Planctomycetota bacterium]
MRTTLLALVVASLAALTAIWNPLTSERSASALVAVHAVPPAGLSVEAKDAAMHRGFDFKFKSDLSTATITIDPLGSRLTDSASLSSRSGSISLTGRFDRLARTIEITAKRSGTEIGSYSWRIEAVLR